MKSSNREPLGHAFEDATLRITIADIVPLRETTATVRKSVKYGQIAASIKEVGIIEPSVVVRDPDNPGRYRLLDGLNRQSLTAPSPILNELPRREKLTTLQQTGLVCPC